ncbi:RNA polymerase sigma factor [Frigoriglobus tundricola]|nr:sigma-70 family RNA polymerase sigma factor [Frigoriglobus tundricola]
MNRLFVLARGGLADAPDSHLLARFHAARDDAALAELVRRYGGLVWQVCRRALPEHADAEDAFQATFLVLVGRCARLRTHPAVGAWLHRTAVLTARNLRRANRRRARLAGRPGADVPVTDPAADRTDARLDLDGALAALPDRFRAPVILCHLQGLTRREAAARLGWPEGTLSAVLAEALRELRTRLGGRDPAAVLAAGGAALVPSGLLAATVRLAQVVAISNPIAAGARPAVAALTREGLRMVSVPRAVLFAAAALMCGLALATVRAGGGAPAPAPPGNPIGAAPAGQPADPKAAAGPRPGDDDLKDLVPVHVTGTVKDGDGNPIAGARVVKNGTIGFAATFGGTEFGGGAVAGANGAYKLGFKTKPGTTVVVTAIGAEADGYVAHRENFGYDELKTAPDKPGRWDFVLAKGEVIAGRVAPPDDEAHVLILVRGPSFTDRFITGKGGTFRFWVSKGTYTVTAVVQTGTAVRNPTLPDTLREGLVIKRAATAERVKSGTENLVLKAP